MGREPCSAVSTEATVEARAPVLARWALAALAIPCAAGATALGLALSVRGLLGAAALCLPVLLAISAWRSRWSAGGDALRVRGLAGERVHPWEAVVRVDRVRGGVVVAVRGASHRMVWLATADRERLLRAVVTRAGLPRVRAELLPVGVLARWARPAGATRAPRAR